MHTRELSVFVENKAGRLAVLTKLLGQAGINIRGFSVADMSDYGIVRLIVDKPDEAAALLRDRSFIVRESN
ncbi:MAG: ACT domain-containing protein, partial [bacterium]|nr:ACT domain-containing protein [bacterium]